MKKLLLTVVCAAFAAVSLAGEPAQKPSFKGFVSNGFWDNWEVSVGGGVTYNAVSGILGKKDPGSIGDRIGWEINLSGTKWFHPVVGARLQLMYGENNNILGSEARPGADYNWPFFYGHVDAMINFSNWVGGYREDRVYYAVPFAGFGYQVANFGDGQVGGKAHDFAFTAGLLNKFRVSEAWDVNLELKAWTYRAGTPAVLAARSGRLDLTYSATVGVSYRFNKRDFERGVPGYTAEDIRAFQDAVAAGTAALAAAEAANERLAEQVRATEAEVRAAKAETAKAVEAAVAAEKDNAPVATTSLYYDYSASQLTAKDKTRLQVAAELIKNGPADRVYKIEGHADQATGSKAGNRRVAESRAKNVYNYLIKCGVNKDQLTYEGLGNDPDIYPNIQKANRTVIIK